jgi:hypothetical protein
VPVTRQSGPSLAGTGGAEAVLLGHVAGSSMEMEAGMQRIVLACAGLALAAALSACGSDRGAPQKVTATRPSVTYSYEGDKLDEAAEKARAYCGNLNQEAKLRDLSTQNGVHYAIYDCR